MAILGIIPARGGSKRIPSKNKIDFCGKPMVAYIVEAALLSQKLDKIVVNSDDDEILEITKTIGGDKITIIKRPEEISGDKALAIEYVNQTLDVLQEIFDIIVILQPTSPLTLPEDIDHTIELLEQSSADSAVSVVELDHAIHPFKMKIMHGDKLLPFIEEENGRMAVHELPQIFVRNCAVYASTIATIQKNQIIGADCRGYVMPPERSVDINTMLDFYFAQFLYSKVYLQVT